MGFFDFPFQRKTRSFVPHSDVLDYLHAFVNRFDLRKIIKLCHQVMFIQPVKESNRWKVNILIYFLILKKSIDSL